MTEEEKHLHPTRTVYRMEGFMEVPRRCCARVAV